MELEQLASLLAVGALLGGVGKGVVGMIFPRGTRGPHVGWRRVFFATMWAHPVFVGMLLGLPDWLPAPAFLGVGDKMMAGRVIWYGLAGLFSSPAFYRLDGTIRGGQGQ